MIKLIHHRGMTSEYWFNLSIALQLGNVSSEIGRTFIAKRAEQWHESKLACERALELLDLTIADPKNKARRKEILYARCHFADHILGINEIKSTDNAWENYFHQFAFAAAREREQRRNHRKFSQ